MSEDHILKCSVCGISFVWTTSELAASALPDRCPMCCRIAPGPGRQRGIVKWFSRARGYGFITAAYGPEVFFHKSGLKDEQAALRAGQLVEFAVGRGPRGAQAEDVEILSVPTS